MLLGYFLEEVRADVVAALSELYIDDFSHNSVGL